MILLGRRAVVASTLVWLLFAPFIQSSADTYVNGAELETDGTDLKKQMLLYREKLAGYRKAHAAYEKLASPYWKSISEKRSRRLKKRALNQRVTLSDYVLEQPPVYSGPPKPKNPEKPPSAAVSVPVVADFLKRAKEQFNFAPEKPSSELDYKRAYAEAASAAGLNSEQCVKIYAFESGGDGGYDVQAGLEYNRPGAHAITTALGYNQLLTTNSIELLAEAGDQFLTALSKKYEVVSGARLESLGQKISILKRMIAFSRSVPDRWRDHAKLADTTKGLGVHALILDVDVGPLLQAQKLLTSTAFAKSHGYTAPLTAAELEMMNLTGDGNGFDIVLMPDDLRGKVPTSNFFQRGGYERNPVAIVNNTVAKLLAATNAKMESEAQLPGARHLASFFHELQ